MKGSLRPVHSPEGLMPNDYRDAALRQTPEQRRAPALAVEDQRQGRLALPGDEMRGQVAPAAGILLDMAIHGQHRASGGIRCHPLSRAKASCQTGIAAGQQAKRAAKGLHLGATIQAEQNVPLARSLHAQDLGVANPPERQKG